MVKKKRGSSRSRIVFRWIPTEKDVNGNVRYVKWYPLEEGLPCQQRECRIHDVASLIRESIYFYNYGIPPSLLTPRKENWKPFDPDTVKKAIESLYAVSYHSLYNMARTLAATNHGLAVRLPSQLNEKGKGLFKKDKKARQKGKISIDTAQTGFLAASLWTSDKYRKEITTSKVYFREFDKLPSVLKKLRRLLNVKEIEQSLIEQYKPFGDEYLFEPFYGGSWSNKWPDLLCRLPVCKIGSTEKIYHDASLDIFSKPKNISYRIKSDNYVDKVNGTINELIEILPFNINDKRLSTWMNWFSGLFILKEEILDRTNTEYSFAGTITYPSLIMGLPSAFAYIGALWAYIFDLMARTLMAAFSNVIYPIYRDINGYMAVQLWKALADKKIPSATANLFNDSPEWLKGLYLESGALKSFREIPDKALLKNVEVENVACSIFREKLGAPIVQAENLNKKPLSVRQIDKLDDDVKFMGWHKDYLAYYPVISPKFEDISGCVNLNKEDRLLYGVRLTAQTQIYIASKILRQGLHILDIEKTKERNRYLRRNLENFRIGAGSYIWGGRKQPHKTHRQGINLDLSFGPLIQKWLPPKKLNDALEKFIKTKKGKEAIKRIASNKRYDFLVSKDKSGLKIHYERLLYIDMICYTNEQEKSNIQRKIVAFEWIFKKKLFTVMENVKCYCTKTIKDESFNTIDEMEAYKKAEKVMTGLPHFSSSDPRTELQDWQRSHIALLAILLTAPKYIMFASPIIYLRAMRAIRKVFSKDGLFLFQKDYIEGIVNELDSIDKDAVPEIIRETFQEEKMPLSTESIFVMKKEGLEWEITDGENHFIIIKNEAEEKKDERKICLEVRLQFTEKILKLTAGIVRDTQYYFDPKKHYNHWHVDFYDEFYANIVSQHRLGSLLFGSITNIFILQQIWLILGINLNPIIKYLGKHYIDDGIPSYLYDPSDEKKDILIKCREYMKAYNERFGRSLEKRNENQVQSGTITKIILDRLFGLYKDSESEYIKPTIAKEGINNPANFEIIKDAIKITREIIIALKKPLIEQGLLKEEDFNLFEVKEPDEIPDAPDNEGREEERLA